LATVLVKFWRNWVWVWKNCCMAGSICPSCGAGFERLFLPWRFTAGWSTPDPDLVFTILSVRDIILDALSQGWNLNGRVTKNSSIRQILLTPVIQV
jgi:hypothetical protein